jgi:cell division protein FtsZ
MGTGEAEGDGRALQAAEKAIANPLLDGVSMKGAKGVIVSIVGGEDMRLMEVDEAANHIRELVDPDANIIWGSAFNDSLNGRIRVSVVATGIDHEASNAPAAPSQPFSFANRPAVSTPVAAPVAPPAPQAAAATPVAAPVAEEEVEPLDLGTAAESMEPASAQAASSAPFTTPKSPAVISDLTDEEELLLGGEKAPEPVAEAEPVRAAPRVATGGGTLFERMSGLSRGVDKAADADAQAKPGGIDIPRFLNRQNNQ